MQVLRATSVSPLRIPTSTNICRRRSSARTRRVLARLSATQHSSLLRAALLFGDAGRNYLNNPSRLNFDLSLIKHTRIRETGELEFRAEAFNIFNHTEFRLYDVDNPGRIGNNIISCYAGQFYSAGFEGKGADCITGASFLHPIDAHRPRTIQLGLKLAF